MLEIPSTGSELVDAMVGLQIVADSMDNIDAKILRIRESLVAMRADSLMGGQLMVSAAQAFAKHPDYEPDDRILFDTELFFIGQLNQFGYIYDPDIPVDSLALNFIKPEVIGLSADESPAFKKLTLQVPVLSITSCVEFAA